MFVQNEVSRTLAHCDLFTLKRDMRAHIYEYFEMVNITGLSDEHLFHIH